MNELDTKSYNKAIEDVIHRLELIEDYLITAALTPDRINTWKEIIAFIEYELIHNLIKTNDVERVQ